MVSVDIFWLMWYFACVKPNQTKGKMRMSSNSSTDCFIDLISCSIFSESIYRFSSSFQGWVLRCFCVTHLCKVSVKTKVSNQKQSTKRDDTENTTPNECSSWSISAGCVNEQLFATKFVYSLFLFRQSSLAVFQSSEKLHLMRLFSWHHYRFRSHTEALPGKETGFSERLMQTDVVTDHL